MNDKPLVSVVMAVHNGADWILKSVESILQQTYEHLELIVIDDGSVDDSAAIVNAIEDKRIRLFKNEKQSGLVYSLNFGISQARGQYIARMDADDISLPERISSQMAILQNDKRIVAVGGWITLVDENDEVIEQWEYPESTKMIMWNQFFNSGFAHPSTLFLASAFKKAGGYLTDHKYAEDFDLWSRLGEVGELYNIQKPLLLYRVHTSSISHSYDDKQTLARHKISTLHIKHYMKDQTFTDSFTGIEPHLEDNIAGIKQILMLRNEYVERESLSALELAHVDNYIMGFSAYILSEVSILDRFVIAKIILSSELSFKTKWRFLLRFPFPPIRPQ
jgi:glycosyltransferase involved in cell wall biosynthesis